MSKLNRSTSWPQVNLVLQLLSYLLYAIGFLLSSDSISVLATGDSDVLQVLTTRFGTDFATGTARRNDGEHACNSPSPSALVSDSRNPQRLKRPQHEVERIEDKSTPPFRSNPVATRSALAGHPQDAFESHKISEALARLDALVPQQQISSEGGSSTNTRQAQRFSQNHSYKVGLYPIVHWQSKKRRLNQEPRTKVEAERSEAFGSSWKSHGTKIQEPIPDLNIPYEEMETSFSPAEPIHRPQGMEVMTMGRGTLDERTAEKTLGLSIRSKSHQLLASSSLPLIYDFSRVYGDGAPKTASTENNIELHDTISTYHAFRVREVPEVVRSEGNHRARAIVQANAALGKDELKNLNLVAAVENFPKELASRWPVAFKANNEDLSPERLPIVTEKRCVEISLAIQAALHTINQIHDTFAPPLYYNSDGLQRAQKEAFEVFKTYWDKILREKSSTLSPSTDLTSSVSAPIKKQKVATVEAFTKEVEPLSDEHAFGLTFLYDRVLLKSTPHPSYRHQLMWALVENWMKEKEARILRIIAIRRDRKYCRFTNLIDDSLLSTANGMEYENVRPEFNFSLKRRWKLIHPTLQGQSSRIEQIDAKKLPINNLIRGFIKTQRSKNKSTRRKKRPS